MTEAGSVKNAEDQKRIQRIADVTGYRTNHVRRILKVLDPPDYVKVQMAVFLFEIPEAKAALIVQMSQEADLPEDPPQGTDPSRPPWFRRLLRWRRRERGADPRP